MPFRGEDQKEILKQTAENKIDFYNEYLESVSKDSRNDSLVMSMLRMMLRTHPENRMSPHQALKLEILKKLDTQSDSVEKSSVASDDR